MKSISFIDSIPPVIYVIYINLYVTLPIRTTFIRHPYLSPIYARPLTFNLCTLGGEQSAARYREVERRPPEQDPQRRNVQTGGYESIHHRIREEHLVPRRDTGTGSRESLAFQIYYRNYIYFMSICIYIISTFKYINSYTTDSD